MPKGVQKEATSEHQDLIDGIEHAVAGGDIPAARQALRSYLFATLGTDCEGSVADALTALSDNPAGQEWAAAVVLRSSWVPEILQTNAANRLAASAVALIEGAIGGIREQAGFAPKDQNYIKYERLSGLKSALVDRLEPLHRPYTTIDSLHGAKADVMRALRHPLVKLCCRPYRLGEVTDAVQAILAKIDRVQQMDTTLDDDVVACSREIEKVSKLVREHPSILTEVALEPFLDHVAGALSTTMAGVRGRFRCVLRRTGGGDLTKRYPLHEEGKRLRIVIPMRNPGPGTAQSVVATISSSSEHVMLEQTELELGRVGPGHFTLPFEITVVDACEAFSAEIHLTWNELGSGTVSEDLFEVRVLAQRTDIDWTIYKYRNPYAESPASGSRFIGRREQVQTLVSRLLQSPMESTYIDGQKRVGKTSLAQAAADEAVRISINEGAGRLQKLYILWGDIAAEDSRTTLRNLGEKLEDFVRGALPTGTDYPAGDYSGTLAPLVKLCQHVSEVQPERRFVAIFDEFDEIAQDLYLQGPLAEVFFSNLRAVTGLPNFCLMLVGGENMPYVMDRQGHKLNRFSRINLTYFSRSDEWEDFEQLIRRPTEDVLEWHLDAISEVFAFSSGNPYFAKAICKEVMKRAVAERDADVSAEEVRLAVQARVPDFESNQFVHLWQDGIYSPVEERETVALKRRRTLAAIARCIKEDREPSLDNIRAERAVSQLSPQELGSILSNFVDREVLEEKSGVYGLRLPVFRMWLSGVGLARLSNDRLAEELATIDEEIEATAKVLPEEIVSLTAGWPPYRGKSIGPEAVRAWLDQRPGAREQRLLFTLLKATRMVSHDENQNRLKQAASFIRDTLGVPTRKKLTDRRSDVVVTYVDGEGKSGQRYASDFAEINLIHRTRILAPSSFGEEFRKANSTSEVKAIVIIDDVVSTGNSLSRNLTNFVNVNADLLNETKPVILALALFATEQGTDRVRTAVSALDYDKIDFRAGEVLTEDDFAFAGETGVFGSVPEKERAKALAEDIGVKIYPDNPLGFGGQGLLLVLPTTVPNNTLPILHSRSRPGSPDWHPLFERVTNG